MSKELYLKYADLKRRYANLELSTDQRIKELEGQLIGQKARSIELGNLRELISRAVEISSGQYGWSEWHKQVKEVMK